MEVGLVGVAGVLGEAVMDHRVLGSKRDYGQGHVHTQGKEMVDAIVVVLVSNGCLGHAGLFIPKVKIIQDVKVKMALMSKQYIFYQN